MLSNHPDLAVVDLHPGWLYCLFQCTTGRSAGEDFQSDTSGETTASDSGRGGSEEDIQLPPLPEMSGLWLSFILDKFCFTHEHADASSLCFFIHVYVRKFKYTDI